MKTFNLLFAILVASSGVSHAADTPNTLKIVISSGPNAGSYEVPSDEVMCMHAKSRNVFTTAWKGFEAPKPKAIEEAGMEIADPDSAQPKLGYARVSFFGTDGKPVVYQTTRSPVALTMSGKTGKISYEGKTSAGIRVTL